MDQNGILYHFDSAHPFTPGEVVALNGVLWQVIGWEKRGESYRVSIEPV